MSYTSRSETGIALGHSICRPTGKLIRVREVGADGGVLTYLGSVGSLNYGHFLVDDLPRLVPLLGNGKTTTVLLPSVSPHMDAIRIEAIQTLASAFCHDAVPEIITKFVDPGAR